jgi:hypothetical protein
MSESLEVLYSNKEGKTSYKWSYYIREYDRILSPCKNKSINILEIGIQNGGSLEVWDEFFTQANIIIGIDIDEKCKDLVYTSDKVKVVIGDSCDKSTIMEVMRHTKSFDLIFDDASHVSKDIIKTFFLYFPKLSFDGLYVIEDLHCSYWDRYEGGLHNPFSAMSFFKNLIDIINYQHWHNNVSISQFLLDFINHIGISSAEIDFDMFLDIHSVEIVNSLCIVKKMSNDLNCINKLSVRGFDSDIVDNDKHLFEDFICNQDQSANFFSKNNFNNSELLSEIEFMRQNLFKCNQDNIEKDNTIYTLRHENFSLHENLYKVTSKLYETEKLLSNSNKQSGFFNIYAIKDFFISLKNKIN